MYVVVWSNTLGIFSVDHSIVLIYNYFSISSYNNTYFLKEYARLCCSKENGRNINIAYILQRCLLNMLITFRFSRQIYKKIKAISASPNYFLWLLNLVTLLLVNAYLTYNIHLCFSG